VATGVRPRDPQIPGQDHPKVLSYIDVLRHRKPVGQRVAVVGAGGIGFDVAEYLVARCTPLHHAGPAGLAGRVGRDRPGPGARRPGAAGPQPGAPAGR
jgi:2,4-dienoyl-CoA reductase (NADPH2)